MRSPHWSHKMGLATSMTARRRALMFAVIADQQTPEMLHHMHFFDDLVRCDEVLDWCVKNKVTGRAFLYFVREYGGTPLPAAQEILRRIFREAKPRPLFAGTDIRS